MFKKIFRLSCTGLLIMLCLPEANAQSASSTPREPKAGDVSPLIKLHRRTPDPQPIPPEISVQINRFFNTIMEDKPEKLETAYTTLFEGTRLAKNPANVPLLAGRTANAISALGPLFEYEHFDTQFIGKRILVATYLGWHEIQPLIWRFTFFRLRTGWTLADLRTEDNLETLIE